MPFLVTRMLIGPVIIACTFLHANPQSSVMGGNLSLPAEYPTLKNDLERMQFLMKTIADSLDEGELTHVLPWAKLGLQMAETNDIDSFKGIFMYDIGKAWTYKYNKYDSAIYYYKKTIHFFPDKQRKYYVFSVREIMDRYSDLGNKDSSFAYMEQLKSLIDTMPESALKKASLSQNIAMVYQGFGMYRSAIQYYQTAIHGNRLNNNKRGLGLALANLGELYNQSGETEKAILVSKEALENLAGVNMPYMQTAANIADYYTKLQRYDSATKYLAISNLVVGKTSDEETRVANQIIQAKIFIAQKDFSSAKNLLNKTVDELSSSDNSWNLCKALLNYADLDTLLHRYDNAKSSLLKALDISRKNEFKAYTLNALQNLALVYFRISDYKSAFKYQNEYASLKDSMESYKSRSDLNDLEISYKTLQKEQEIVMLKKDNDIKTLQLKNAGKSKTFMLLGGGFLILLFLVIYYQRNRRSKIEAQKIKAELETQVLRAQMNPHFIFNSLNSIENFIMQNEKRLASDYLNKFARLIRMILDSSRNEVVPIAKDMEALQLYIDLEQLRFNNKFTYKTMVDPALLGGDYRVPSLLIQPYVENAIVHGLAHSEKNDLNLTVSAFLENDNIKYVIQDNGIGREKAGEYNQQNKPQHKSVGLKITEGRISIFNGQNSPNGSIRFTDLYDEYHQSAGTRVEVTIKAI